MAGAPARDLAQQQGGHFFADVDFAPQDLPGGGHQVPSVVGFHDEPAGAALQSALGIDPNSDKPLRRVAKWVAHYERFCRLLQDAFDGYIQFFLQILICHAIASG